MRSTALRLSAFALASFLIVSTAPPRFATAAGDPILIGATVSESGPGATLGRPEADSIQMAVDEINKAGGVNGRPLQAAILDDESNATTAVNNTRKLLDQHVVAIIGSSLTQTSLAMIPLATAAKVPMISLASSSQVIQPVGDRQWIFKMPITDFHVAQVMQEYMRKKKQTKVSVIYRDDDYGKTGLSHFNDAGKRFGFEVLNAEAINARASDATTQLTHVKSAAPQAIVAWTTLPSAGVIIKAYKELGLSLPIYYSDGSATGVFPQQAGAALNGAYIASTKINVADTLPNNDPQKKILTHYIDAFVKGYPKDAPVSIFGGFGYDSVYVLKQAIQRAKGTDGEKLRQALEHTEYLGVTGQFRMSAADHNGLSVFSLVLTQVENGKFILAK
ncbi:MAG TPA: ABC transporter substrate-binding protein [Candidatus Elarobacter sp.]|jgi:branched-chain amino acid transport system substrate-binding protein